MGIKAGWQATAGGGEIESKIIKTSFSQSPQRAQRKAENQEPLS